jgi:GNAT superfamily N-acetyltransferase
MVGVSLGVPDFNRILARLDGHTWHPEAAAFFRSPPTDEAVFLLTSLHRAWQGQGVGKLLNAGLLFQARQRGYRALSGTWLDEDNIANRRQVEALGMRPWHELVIVERALA